MPDLSAVSALREALHAAGYTADGVLDLLGPEAHAALARGETVPARRATRGGSPLETLVRLFLLQDRVPSGAAEAALPMPAATALGLVAGAGDDVRAVLDVRPYGPDDAPPDATWWVVSDLGTGLDGISRPLPEDHVLGVGGASTTLAQITPRRPARFGRALDVGTGCGVQALHLAQHLTSDPTSTEARVVGTDVLPRALHLAGLTAALSGVDLDLRRGHLYEPVAGERFDLVVSNPPFVVSPQGRHVYRDSGLPGDEVCRRLLAQAGDVLAEGGVLVMLANWLHRAAESWQERVSSWVPQDAPVDAWVVERDVADPAAYVATWLRDSGETASPRYRESYDTWLDALERDGVEGVGFGWVVARRRGPSSRGAAREATVRTEEWPHAVAQPLGPHVLAELDRTAWLHSRTAAELLATAFRVGDDVTQEQHGAPGAEDPHTVVLRRGSGMRRARRVGTEVAAVAGACDGTLELGRLADAVATVLQRDAVTVRTVVVEGVRALVEEGFLEPAGARPR